MIHIEKKAVVVTNYQDIPVSGVCDSCNKELKGTDDLYDYYRVVTHHNNWGNDSCDSYEGYDFCCIDCMTKFVNNYWSQRRKNYIAGRDTHEMEISHKHRLEQHPYPCY